MDHLYISIAPAPPFATACTNILDDLFIWEILVQLRAEYIMIYKEIFIDDNNFVFRHRGLFHECPPSMSIISRKIFSRMNFSSPRISSSIAFAWERNWLA
jgi:hypothetical protein